MIMSSLLTSLEDIVRGNYTLTTVVDSFTVNTCTDQFETSVSFQAFDLVYTYRGVGNLLVGFAWFLRASRFQGQN